MDRSGYLPKKLLIKKAISDLFMHLRSLAGNNRIAKGFRALNYHSISDSFLQEDASAQMTTPKERFEAQLKFLKENGYKVLSCSEAVDSLRGNAAIPSGSVCLTFDDGFKDNLTNGLPILEKYGFRAVVFLTVDYIGSSARYLNWDEIRLLSRTGLISFGSHSLSHRKLSSLGQEELAKEIADSKKMLEDNLKTEIDLFAYPFGSYGSFDAKTEQVVRSCGYKAAFTTIAGSNNSKTDLFRLQRTRISWYDDEREFKKELEGDYDWYRIWQRTGIAA